MSQAQVNQSQLESWQN